MLIARTWRGRAARPSRHAFWCWPLLPVVLCTASRAHAACGDGVLESALETCDDGNVAAADGCTASCQREAGYLCTGAPSLCCFADAAAAYALLGEATLDATTGEITLVPSVAFRNGVGWYRLPLDLTSPFNIRFALNLGNRDDAPLSNAVDTGADGVALLFQRDPRGLAAQGETGGVTGSYGSEFGAQGIVPVLGVEFDTYNNLAAYADETTGDEDHLGIFHTRATPGTNHLVPTVCMNEGGTCKNYEDGRYHAVSVRWTGDLDHHLLISLDGAQRIDLGDDLVGGYFGDDPKGITFGLAAGTGGAFNVQKVCALAPVGFAVPRDLDRDGQDDSVDVDDDGDGVSDRDETSAVFAAEDPGADHDLDGTPNASDPEYWTAILHAPLDCADVVAPMGACDRMPSTIDFDGDGTIDSSDLDSDGDGAPDATDPARRDACVPSPTLSTCAVPVVDAGLAPGGAADASPSDASVRDASTTAMDAALAPATGACRDASDPVCATLDSDGDGVPNVGDVAANNPCLPDGRVLACASGDRDADGLPNSFECTGLTSCRDTDRDGVADYADTDSDGDGLPDRAECSDANACPDSDGNGVPDLLQGKPSTDSGGCSLQASGGSASALGWLLATLITSLFARGVGPALARAKKNRARRRVRSSKPRPPAHDASNP
jgi:cysteine-rich repeat protein